MNNFDSENMLLMMVFFLGAYIVLQVYIIFKLKTIIHKLFEILFQFEIAIGRHKFPGKIQTVKINKCCQNCKYRLTYYSTDSKIPGYIYYRCQLTRKKVPAEFLCKDFVFDPQTYNV